MGNFKSIHFMKAFSLNLEPFALMKSIGRNIQNIDLNGPPKCIKMAPKPGLGGAFSCTWGITLLQKPTHYSTFRKFWLIGFMDTFSVNIEPFALMKSIL